MVAVDFGGSRQDREGIEHIFSFYLNADSAGFFDVLFDIYQSGLHGCIAFSAGVTLRVVRAKGREGWRADKGLMRICCPVPDELPFGQGLYGALRGIVQYCTVEGTPAWISLVCTHWREAWREALAMFVITSGSVPYGRVL